MEEAIRKAVSRLKRCTWDGRSIPIRADIQTLLDAYREAAFPEPPKGRRVWYRGWECYYGYGSVAWTGMGWVACLGGEDLDAVTVDARTWEELLDEIDDHEMIGG